MTKRIAFVVQRYGEDVNGGAEYITRMYAEKLSAEFDVEVLTTTAIDHYTWRNEYKPGVSESRGVTIRRFPVAKERHMESFAVLCNKVFNTETSLAMQRKWMEDQGPYAPELIEFIRAHREDYDQFIFVPYLYYQSYFGLLEVADKAILVPAAHDEPSLYLELFKETFERVSKLAFLTPEEQALVQKHFEVADKPQAVVGVGIETDQIEPQEILALSGQNYFLYVGRIEEGKGCKEMFDFFTLYKERFPSDLKLVLVGKSNMPIPDRADVMHLGFVSEGEKKHAVQNAKFLLMPSRYESLSLVLLEAFEQGTPALVNGHCDVLRGHCLRSNAGLWFEDYYEFEEAVERVLTTRLNHSFGVNARQYIQNSYGWDFAIEEWRQLISEE